MAKFCANCGHHVDDGDTFCDNCGARLNDNTATDASAESRLPPPPSPAANLSQGTVKSGSKTTIAITLSIVSLSAVLFVVLFIAPGFLRTKNVQPIKNDSRTVSSSTDLVVSDDKKYDTSKTKITAVTTTESTISYSQKVISSETSAPITTMPSETTAPVTDIEETTTISENDHSLDEKTAAYAEALAFSTDDRPDYSEFEWCFGQGGLVYNVPDHAEMITDPLGYTGGWKAMVIYNPTNSAGTFMRELDNIDIGVYDDTCIITIDWYYMEIDGSESYNEENVEDSNFFGTVTDTGLYASGDAEISINSLWKADGKEYALGALITSDGLPAYLAMVRP